MMISRIVRQIEFASLRRFQGAFTAIQFNPVHSYQTLYVHVPDKPIHERYIKTPTDKQVLDAWLTGEKWVTRKVKMKCIGKIYIGFNQSWMEIRPHVHFKWLERYTNVK